MEKEKLNAILEGIRQLEKRVTDIENDLAHDRENMQNITITNGQIVAEVGELRRTVNLLSEKIKNKVADVTEGLQVATDQLNQTIQKKKEVVISDKKVSLWRRIFK